MNWPLPPRRCARCGWTHTRYVGCTDEALHRLSAVWRLSSERADSVEKVALARYWWAMIDD